MKTVPNEIKGFFGQYRFLSNFYPSKVTFEGVEYPTVEHAYQAAKTNDWVIRGHISRMDTPAQAKRAGRTLNQIDWHERSLKTMEDLVLLKFISDTDLRRLLLITGDAYLEETNKWHDTFWGVCEGVGENHLGKILMRVREKIRNEKGI